MRWPVVFHGVFWLSLTAGLLSASFVFPPLQSPPYAALMACSLIAAMGGTGLLITNWPTGIRVDAAGIQIGGIRRAGRRGRAGAGRLPPASAQRRAVFFCPWDDLHLAQVVTDRRELRRLSRLGRGGTITRLGLLWSPFMRAALVMRINPYAVSAPEFRPPDPHRYWFRVARLRTYALYSVWLAPTRRPDALRAALAEQRVPGPATAGWDFTGYIGASQYPSGYGEPTRGRAVVLAFKAVLFVAASAFLAGLIVTALRSPVTGYTVVGFAFVGGLWLRSAIWLFRPLWRRLLGSRRRAAPSTRRSGRPIRPRT